MNKWFFIFFKCTEKGKVTNARYNFLHVKTNKETILYVCFFPLLTLTNNHTCTSTEPIIWCSFCVYVGNCVFKSCILHVWWWWSVYDLGPWTEEGSTCVALVLRIWWCWALCTWLNLWGSNHFAVFYFSDVTRRDTGYILWWVQPVALHFVTLDSRLILGHRKLEKSNGWLCNKLEGLLICKLSRGLW